MQSAVVMVEPVFRIWVVASQSCRLNPMTEMTLAATPKATAASAPDIALRMPQDALGSCVDAKDEEDGEDGRLNKREA